MRARSLCCLANTLLCSGAVWVPLNQREWFSTQLVDTALRSCKHWIVNGVYTPRKEISSELDSFLAHSGYVICPGIVNYVKFKDISMLFSRKTQEFGATQSQDTIQPPDSVCFGLSPLMFVFVHCSTFVLTVKHCIQNLLLSNNQLLTTHLFTRTRRQTPHRTDL